MATKREAQKRDEIERAVDELRAALAVAESRLAPERQLVGVA